MENINKDDEILKPSRLTTVDNPWNPFTHFTEWYNEDVKNGYNTSAVYANAVTEKLKSLGLSLEEISDNKYCEIVDEVLEDLISEFPLLYSKVNEETETI